MAESASNRDDILKLIKELAQTVFDQAAKTKYRYIYNSSVEVNNEGLCAVLVPTYELMKTWVTSTLGTAFSQEMYNNLCSSISNDQTIIDLRKQLNSFTNENGDTTVITNKNASNDTITDPNTTTKKDEKKDAETKTTADAASYASEESTSETLKADYDAANATFVSAWDPRIYTMDSFLANAEDDTVKNQAVRIPFASNTIATAFSEQVYTLEKSAALRMLADADHMESYDMAHLGISKEEADQLAPMTGDWDGAAAQAERASSENGESSNTPSTADAGSSDTASVIKKLNPSDKIMLNQTAIFRTDPGNYGTLALMNRFALTKLTGSLAAVTENSAMNYMYDIRDRRRFYDVAVESATFDPMTVSNPTVSQLIAWGNADKWGRTPYTYQDFVFCKYYGIIPNNRLLTLRRYTVPTRDNLCFDSMYGRAENVDTSTATGMNDPKTARVNSKANMKTPQGTFPPRASVVAYVGGDTGNTLSSVMNFSTGIPWKDLEAKIHEVQGDEGESLQLVIDKMFEGGGFGTAENNPISGVLGGLTTATGKVLSYGKFALAVNGSFGQSEAVMNATYNAQSDPYGASGPYENRIVGPVNRIDKVKLREHGITFEQTLTVKCQYETKAIAGINPKAAILDVLGNCLEMVSPSAVFWGGGHRFQVNPRTYPFHDGGWRDSFMEKIYQGKFLGKNGALAVLGSGLKKFATDKDGNFSPEALFKSAVGGVGTILGAISAGLSAIGSSIGIGSIGDLLSAGAKALGGAADSVGGEGSLAKGTKAFNNLTSNLSNMWHDKCMQQTTFPTMSGMGAILIGEPVGEWHLTVGNPLNPIMVIGNLICEKVSILWNEELGPDDFPTGFTAEYTLQHGMARDKDAIESMFNRGQGKYYVLPDYMKMSSDMETKVDKFTGNSEGRTGKLSYMSVGAVKKAGSDVLSQVGGGHLKNISYIQSGKTPSNHANPDTGLITKFTPLNTNADRSLSDIRNTSFITSKSIAITMASKAVRKHGG